ncbi:MAG: S41 family peptidase [Saprospiraceae bacterium]
MSNTPSKQYNVLQPLILGVAIVIGMMAGYKMNEIPEESLVSISSSKQINSQGPYGRIEELIRYIDSKYITGVDVDKMTEDAIQAVFASLDPHSIYINPLEITDINTQMNGHYKGLGIENFFIEDTIVVSAVLPDSPAEKAGLKPFDKIISINDSIIAGKSLQFDAIRQMLRSEVEGAISLTISRDAILKKITILPKEIMVPSVHAQYLDDAQAVFVRIDRFGNKTYQEFMLAIEPYFEKKSKAKHLILDLRDNPGGFLPEATNILCQLFKEKDKLLVYTEGRNLKRNDYKSNGKAFFDIEKIVVLIDENSASASEIVAGAIQDWDRGIIIGGDHMEKDFGTGAISFE